MPRKAAGPPAPKPGAQSPPVKVLIVGGGCAGISAAWELAKQPGFEIHVYECRLQLGGKGGSTRDGHGRILEHGLHVWLGFYENAFRMMRECYAVVEAQGWGPDAAPGHRLAHARFDDAFFPEPHVGVAGTPRDAWEVWSGQLPPMPGAPGTPLDADSNPFSLPHYLAHALALVRSLVHSMVGGADAGAGGAPRPDERSPTDEAMDLDFEVDFARAPRAAIEGLAERLRGGAFVSASVLLQAIAIFEDWLRSVNFAPQVADSALALVEAITVQVRRQLSRALALDPRARWKSTVVDIVMTIFVGLYRDRVFWKEDGLDSLNRFDYRTWLRKHGASYDALESPFLRGIYDLVFAYRDGDRAKPELAAGVALRGALRMFLGYRGAMFWRLRSGMGDAVFAPLYKVLAKAPRDKKTGLASPVRFHFGHRLERLDFEPPAGKAPLARLSTVALRQHATLAEKRVLDHFGGWPERPAGRRLRQRRLIELRADKEFHVVVVACDAESFKLACEGGQGGILGHLPRWASALDHADTVATRAVQLWLDSSLDELGWLRGPAVLSALGAPLDTWADTTHVLASEQAWRDARAKDESGKAATSAARSLAYLCGVSRSDDKQFDDELKALLEGQVRIGRPSSWMRELWPRAFDKDGDVVRRLVDSMGRAAQAGALKGLHRRLNALGSDRYAQSLPGSVEHRLSPLDRSVSNLTVAGDWTACGLDAGCVEAAVMSGRLAAHAVSGGTPALEAIVGFDHP